MTNYWETSEWLVFSYSGPDPRNNLSLGRNHGHFLMAAAPLRPLIGFRLVLLWPSGPDIRIILNSPGPLETCWQRRATGQPPHVYFDVSGAEMEININECEDTRGAGPGHKTISGRAPVWCDAGDLYFSVLTLSDEDMRHIRHCPGDQRQCDRGFGFGTEFSWAWASWPGPPRQPRRPWPALGVAWRVSQNSERKCNEDGFIISIQTGIACPETPEPDWTEIFCYGVYIRPSD